jgi:DNA polymerase-3 subunit delta
MMHILHGSDRLAVRERRKALLAELLPAGDDLALSRLDGAKCSADELTRAVSVMPFFGGVSVVMVDDLLTRFESKRRKAAPAAEEAADAPDDGDAPDAPLLPGKNDPSRPFAAALGQIAPATTVLLWERGAITKTNALLKALAKTATVAVFDAPKAGEIEDWIHARARAQGVRLKPDVPRLLAEHLGADPETLDEELTKLAVYVGEGGTIDTATVRLLTPQTRQADTLALLNAASGNRTGEALGLLHELLADGVVPVAIIGMLASQVRKLLQVQSLAVRRLPPPEIAARLGMHPYAAKMTAESLRHYTPAGLRALHGRLLQADSDIKTGQADGEAALELLVLDLARGLK